MHPSDRAHFKRVFCRAPLSLAKSQLASLPCIDVTVLYSCSYSCATFLCHDERCYLSVCISAASEVYTEYDNPLCGAGRSFGSTTV